MSPKLIKGVAKALKKSKLLYKVKHPSLIVGTDTGHFFKSLGKAYKKRGMSGLLSEAAKYKDPLHNAAKGKKLYYTHSAQAVRPTISRGIRTSIGNTAANIKELTKPGKGIKNISDLVTKQLRTERLQEVDPSRIIKNKKGQKVYKSSIPFVRKKVIGKTNRGTVVVKKTPIGAGVGMAMSGPGWGLIDYAGSEEKNQAKRISHALGDSALWTVSPPVAIAAPLLTDILKPKKNINR